MNISELVTTRISHDLIGNIGAFANAVELLEDDEDSMDEIRPILKVSSDILNARLKFFRMAFGLSGRNLEQTDLVLKICADYVATLNINNPIGFRAGIISGKYAREIMLAVMMAADTIIKGASISITENADGAKVEVASDNPLSTPKTEAMQNLINGLHPTDNLSLYAPLYYLLELGRTVSISYEKSLVITVK